MKSKLEINKRLELSPSKYRERGLLSGLVWFLCLMVSQPSWVI